VKPAARTVSIGADAPATGWLSRLDEAEVGQVRRTRQERLPLALMRRTVAMIASLARRISVSNPAQTL